MKFDIMMFDKKKLNKKVSLKYIKLWKRLKQYKNWK